MRRISGRLLISSPDKLERLTLINNFVHDTTGQPPFEKGKVRDLLRSTDDLSYADIKECLAQVIFARVRKDEEAKYFIEEKLANGRIGFRATYKRSQCAVKMTIKPEDLLASYITEIQILTQVKEFSAGISLSDVAELEAFDTNHRRPR